MNQKNISKLTIFGLMLLFLLSTHGLAQLQLQKTVTSGSSAILTGENNGEWLRWDDGINSKAFSGPKIWWTSAIYFDTFDLADYDGWHVTKIEVYQNHLAYEGLIKIWQGPDINNLTEYVSQTLPMKEHTWHKIVLDRPHFIDASRKLVFGVEWDDIGDWHFPAGVQGKYPPQYKGEMIMYGVYPGTWQYICTDKGFCNTWNKAIYVEYLETYTVTFEITDAKTGEDIDDAIVTLDNKTNEPGDYIFDNILPGTYDYKVEKGGYVSVEGEVEIINEDITVVVEIKPLAYHPLVYINRVWSNYNHYHTYEYHIKDSLILNDNVYYGLYSEHGFGRGFLREDTIKRMVFFKEKLDENERLLYDFGIKTGDTINYYGLWGKFVVDTLYNYELINGSERRRWILREIGGWSQIVHWIEGIGSITQDLLRPGGHDASTYYTVLLCCFENEELVYMNSFWNTCYIPPNYVEELTEYKYVISPNPASDKLFVQSNNIKQIKIFNIHGKLLLNTGIRGESYIDISHLPSGLILIRLYTNSNEIINYKIIKI